MYALAFGQDGVLPSDLILATLNGSGALFPYVMCLLRFLSLQLNLCLPQTGYHPVNLPHFRRRT
jgi:hypothetical protein